MRWLKIGKVDIINNPAFPEIINEARKLPNNKMGKLNFMKGLEVAKNNKFERYFISNNNKIKNVELLCEEFLGSISYLYVNKTELFPTTFKSAFELYLKLKNKINKLT